MNQTPYEKRLRSIANVASSLHDFATVELVEKMIGLLQVAQYGPLQVHFTFLHPIYRSRIGVPPTSREEDEAAERGPGTPH